MRIVSESAPLSGPQSRASILLDFVAKSFTLETGFSAEIHQHDVITRTVLLCTLAGLSYSFHGGAILESHPIYSIYARVSIART